MVVVLLAGQLIAAGLARHFHPHQSGILYKRTNVAVDRGDTEPLDLLAGEMQNLIRRQGPVGLLKGSANCFFLLSIALHGLNYSVAVAAGLVSETKGNKSRQVSTGERHCRGSG